MRLKPLLDADTGQQALAAQPPDSRQKRVGPVTQRTTATRGRGALAIEMGSPEADDRGVDKVEARAVLAAEMESLRQLSYQQLVERLLDREETLEVLGASGTRYQIELQGVWDARPNDVLRILGSVDDGGWSAFVPLADDFLIAPDGSFVGE